MDKNYKYGTKYKNNFGNGARLNELPVGEWWMGNKFIMPFTNQANKLKVFFELINAMYHGSFTF